MNAFAPATPDQLLHGINEDAGVVGVFLDPGDDATMMIYRHADDRRECERVPFYPFFHITDATLLEGLPAKHWIRDLEGPGHYRHLCIVTRWRDMWDAAQYASAKLQERTGSRIDVTRQEEILLRNDPACQFLLQSGRTSFKGMEFASLRRLQIAAAVIATHGYSNPDRDADAVVAVALSDSLGWSRLIASDDEEALIAECIEAIRKRDPDVIEGHHLHAFTLPYLIRRAGRHRLHPAIGREGHAPALSSVRGREGTADRGVFQVHGRHLVDTAFFLSPEERDRSESGAQSLQQLLIQQGFDIGSRVPVPPGKVGWLWKHERKKLMDHLQERLIEVEFLCSSLSRSSFALARCVPLNYASLFTAGSSIKIELMMIREYLRTHSALPRPEPVVPTIGGYSAVYRTGLFERVLHVDVESMYPSIMISRKLEPASDPLHVFLPLLEKLTQIRLDMKREMVEEQSGTKRRELDALQYAYKILINSFYGYLGYPFALFNDSRTSEAVVREGRAILTSLIAVIRESGGLPIEVDTDGIYFMPPPYIDDAEKEKNLLERLAMSLPQGIRIAIGGRHRKMLSYKIKNYALLDLSERMTIKGSSLAARSMEKFARRYVESCVECLLREDIEGLQNLYRNLAADFQAHRLEVRDFARVETLRESTEDYNREIQSRGAVKKAHSSVHEALLRSGRYAKGGERIAYYFAGNDPSAKPHEISKLADEWIATAPDENTLYYLRRIGELNAKFEDFFTPADFAAIFNLTNELFSPDLSRIRIVSKKIAD